MKKNILLLLTISILLAAGSCNKNTSTSSTHQNYFNARFDNYFSPGESGLMLFLSDMSGNILAQKSLEGLHGNFNVYLYSTAAPFPDLIVETLVYKGPPSGGKSTVYLYTYLQILPANWQWKTFHADSLGCTNLNFSVIPPQTAYSISTSSQWIHGDGLPSSVPVSLGKIPDNVYIMLNTVTNGTRYKWLSGIGTQYSYPVSLSSTDATLSKTIPIPPASSFSYRLSGYLQPGVHSTDLFTLDYGDQEGTNADSITLHYPGTLFSDFQFYMNIFDPSDSRKQWYEYDFGMIPERIDHMIGNIVVLDSTPAHYNVQATGGFDRLGSTWEFNPVGPYQYQWTVYGSPSATSFHFPELPGDLAAKFTGFSVDSLKLSSVEIKDFSGIDNYDDLIKSMFVSGKYIADIVPRYSGLIYHMSPSKLR